MEKNRLSEFRQKKSMSALELAAKLKVSQSKFSKIENGWVEPSREFKQSCAEALDISEDILFPETEDSEYQAIQLPIRDKILKQFDTYLRYKDGMFCGRFLTQLEINKWKSRLSVALDELIRSRIPLDEALGQNLILKIRKMIDKEETAILKKKEELMSSRGIAIEDQGAKDCED